MKFFPFQPFPVLQWRRSIVAFLLTTVLLITGCQAKAPSQFSQAQQDSSKRGVTAVAKDATQGSQFNRFFPKPTDGYERVYTQEKKGFAEAKLKKAGRDVAMLSISDTSSLPTAAAKYQNSTSKISGYPAANMGNTQTGILVGKYQIKVLSRDTSFNQAEREAWIARFDLKGLERLKG
jgi:zona occludens toxin (predicted ATPase)